MFGSSTSGAGGKWNGGSSPTAGEIGHYGGGGGGGTGSQNYGTATTGGNGGDGYIRIEYQKNTATTGGSYLFTQDGNDAYFVTPGTTTATQITNDRVIQVDITAGGSGYTSTPTATFSAPPAGVRATGSVNLSGGVVTSISITNAGSGYVTAPTISITGGGGSSATATATLSAFPSDPLAVGAIYIDGYTCVLTTTGRLYNSEIERPDLWKALNYISAEAEPDAGVAIAKLFNYVVTFGQWSTEFFSDAGNAQGSPFSNASSYRFEIGCPNGNSVVNVEQSLVFLGQGKTTGIGCYMLNGLSPEKISTRYIERYLNDDPMLNIRAWSFKYAGHTLYVLNLLDSDLTFVYDIDEKVWYQWTSQSGGVETGFDVSYYAHSEDQYYAQEISDGNVYIISPSIYQDAGQDIWVRTVTDLMDNGTTKRKFIRRVEVVGDKTLASAIAMIRHTDDDYYTWSSYRNVDLSVKRTRVVQCGSTRRRAWEFFYSGNTALRVQALEIEFDVGGMDGG